MNLNIIYPAPMLEPLALLASSESESVIGNYPLDGEF